MFKVCGFIPYEHETIAYVLKENFFSVIAKRTFNNLAKYLNLCAASGFVKLVQEIKKYRLEIIRPVFCCINGLNSR
jgi:hypothetical protein